MLLRSLWKPGLATVWLILVLPWRDALGGDEAVFSVSWSAPDRVVVPMKLRNGVPTVSCLVNGREVWMLLDTGSQRCVLEADAARDVGIRTIEGARAKVEVAGVHGKEAAMLGMPRSMAVGSWRWSGLPCVVRTQRKVAVKGPLFAPSLVAFNILGLDALQAMCSYVTIDYARREVVFGFRRRFQPAHPQASRQSWHLRDGAIFIPTSHDGHSWWSLLDTGASSELEINREIAGHFGTKKPTRWIDASHFGFGDPAGGLRRRLACLTLAQVSCLGRSWLDVDALLKAGEPKIGSGMCRVFRLTVDFAGGQIWLEVPLGRTR